MNCPKCAEPMVQVYFGGVEVDRCRLCQGIFFDALEKERLREARGADAIDPGHPSLGARFNQRMQINCPRCGAHMVGMADSGQPHIQFEYCAACGGSFFDAGEFHDLKHHDIVDLFKDLAIRRKMRSRSAFIHERRK